MVTSLTASDTVSLQQCISRCTQNLVNLIISLNVEKEPHKYCINSNNEVSTLYWQLEISHSFLHYLHGQSSAKDNIVLSTQYPALLWFTVYSTT
jgi:hypothetical protein